MGRSAFLQKGRQVEVNEAVLGETAFGQSTGPCTEHRRLPLARYANYFEVGYNAYEFLVDVGQVEPQSGEIQIVGRIAVGPVYAKLLSRLLADLVKQFELSHDVIPDFEDEMHDALELTNPHEFERLAINVRRQNRPNDHSPRPEDPTHPGISQKR